MTREEAIEILQGAIKKPNTKDGYLGQAIDMAIKALKQESVLDEIRADIENDWQLKEFPASPFSCGLRHALEIIDKNRKESEEMQDVVKRKAGTPREDYEPLYNCENWIP